MASRIRQTTTRSGSSGRSGSNVRTGSTGSSSSSSTRRSGSANYDVNLGSGPGTTGRRVEGTLGRTPAQRARSSAVRARAAGVVSSSDPGGFNASGLIGAITNAVNAYLAPSTPGRTTGNESVVRAPDRSGSRPSSVSRGSTAGTGTARAITRGPSTAPVARGGQSVKKVTAKGKQGGGAGRTVRF